MKAQINGITLDGQPEEIIQALTMLKGEQAVLTEETAETAKKAKREKKTKTEKHPKTKKPSPTRRARRPKGMGDDLRRRCEAIATYAFNHNATVPQAQRALIADGVIKKARLNSTAEQYAYRRIKKKVEETGRPYSPPHAKGKNRFFPKGHEPTKKHHKRRDNKAMTERNALIADVALKDNISPHAATKNLFKQGKIQQKRIANKQIRDIYADIKKKAKEANTPYYPRGVTRKNHYYPDGKMPEKATGKKKKKSDKRAQRMRFVASRAKWLVNKYGYQMERAMRVASEEWRQGNWKNRKVSKLSEKLAPVGVGQRSPAPVVMADKFQNAALLSLLGHIARHNSHATFSMDGQNIGVESYKDWVDVVRNVVTKSAAITAHLGLKGAFKSKQEGGVSYGLTIIHER